MLGSMIQTLPKTLCVFISILIFGALMAACSLFTPAVSPGEVLFQDDFSRAESGWDRYADDIYQADYHAGSYRIKLSQVNRMVWSRPQLNFEDVLIRVESQRLSGPTDNVFGVICRYVDHDHFTFFLISSDGFAGIGRYAGGEKELLSHETLLPTDVIGPPDSSNLIQASCVGSELTLWVNGERVADATAPDVTKGDVGLIVGAYDEGEVEIQFDNFSTLMP
jgi:hypothetical protein